MDTNARDRQARIERDDRRRGLLMLFRAFEVALRELVDRISHPAGAVAAQDVRPEHAQRGIENDALA
jgi:hypothetical protein